jgi:threonine dehydrogenase-like Zn-dependent dehydrogenase
MKAIAVYPGKPHSMHLEDMPMPKITDIPNGQGILVKVLRVGVDGTDKEINAAEYGNAPEGEQFLIEGFVLGNKVMVGTVNASHADFVSGVNDLVKAEAFFPGWLNKLLTTRINGLENYAEMLHHLIEDKEAIKVYVEVAQAM